MKIKEKGISDSGESAEKSDQDGIKASPDLHKPSVGQKVLKGINYIEDSVMVLGVGFIAVAVLLQAFFRYAVRGMPLGLEEMALIVAAWVYFIGSGLATRDKAHITITLLDQIPLSNAWRKTIHFIGDVIVVLISGAFAYFAIDLTLNVHRAGILIVPFNIPASVFRFSPLAIGLVLCTLYALVIAVQGLCKPMGEHGDSKSS